MERYRELIARSLTEPLGKSVDEVASMLRTPPEPEMGDFAFPCFTLAKEWRQAPAQIALTLASQVAVSAPVATVTAQGPYLNFTLDNHILSREILGRVLEDEAAYGHSDVGKGKCALVEYSSPNIAKELAFHHIRGTMIGHALRQILSACGYTVLGINHLGDWGTPFGLLIAAYKRFGWDDQADVEDIVQLNALYVRASAEARQDAAFAEEGRLWFQRLESGDDEANTIWRWVVEVSLAEFQKVYNLLGVSFEHVLGESFYGQFVDETQALLEERDLITESDGALVVDLEEADMPPFLLKKQDGASLYSTRDLASAIYRQREWKFDMSLYVVDMGQSLHFKQVFKVLEMAGFDWAQNCAHIPFGLVLTKNPSSGKWEKGSSRQGNASLLKTVLEEAIDMARDKIAESNPDLSDVDKVAQQVGIGAVVFHNVCHRRVRDVRFDKEEILNPYGETGPYLQYTHARCASVLALASDYGLVRGADEVDFGLLQEPEEGALIRKLAAYPGAVTDAARESEPSVVAQHLLDLASDFNSYWTRGSRDHDVRIMRPDAPEVTAARVALTAAVRIVLRNGLHLLGVATPDAM